MDKTVKVYILMLSKRLTRTRKFSFTEDIKDATSPWKPLNIERIYYRHTRLYSGGHNIPGIPGFKMPGIFYRSK